MGSRADTCRQAAGRMHRHGKTNSEFCYLCEHASKQQYGQPRKCYGFSECMINLSKDDNQRERKQSFSDYGI
jgi:hypothetical protein